MNHPIGNEVIKRCDSRRIDISVTILDRNSYVGPLRRLQLHAILQEGAVADEVGNNMILEEGLFLCGRRVLRERCGRCERVCRIWNEECDIRDIQDLIDIRVCRTEIIPDAENGDEVFKIGCRDLQHC